MHVVRRIVSMFRLLMIVSESIILDDYLKSGTVRIRVDYVLQNSFPVDLSLKASLGFNTSPASTN